jgi:hypothetical protein
MQQSVPREADSHLASQEVSSFYKLEDSLLCSQEPASGVCPGTGG